MKDMFFQLVSESLNRYRPSCSNYSTKTINSNLEIVYISNNRRILIDSWC